MCENHGKVYGGFMFLCKSPKDVDLIPKKIYVKSLNDLEKKPSERENDSSVSLDITAISHRRVEKMLYQYDRMFDDDYNRSPFHWPDRQYEDVDTEAGARKLLNIQQSPTDSSPIRRDIPQINQDQAVLGDNDVTDEKISLLDLAACVPPLFGSIQLSSFIQFMEYLKLQKVKKVYMYVMDISQEIQSILRYYRDMGFLVTVPWRLPASVGSTIWYHGQIVTVQDCLYRTMGNYDYVAFLDMDEVIVPKTSSDWSTMLQGLESETRGEDYVVAGGYRFLSAFFDPDSPYSQQTPTPKHKLSFLTSVYRTKSYSRMRTKLLVQPEYVVEMGIHHISQPLVTFYNVTVKDVAIETASIHHFRSCLTVTSSKVVCSDVVKDTSIHKFAEKLNSGYQTTVKQIVHLLKSK